MRVYVEQLGSTIEVPDGMDSQEIDKLIQRDLMGTEPVEQEPVKPSVTDEIDTEIGVPVGDPNVAVGAAETALSLLTGLVSFPISGLAGLTKIITHGAVSMPEAPGEEIPGTYANLENAEMAMNKISEAIIYQPKTEPGKTFTDIAGKALALPSDAVRTYGKALVDVSEPMFMPEAPGEEQAGALPPWIATTLTTPLEFAVYGAIFKRLHGFMPKSLEGKKVSFDDVLQAERMVSESLPSQLAPREPAGIPSELGTFTPLPEGARRSTLIKTISDRIDVPIRHGKFRTKRGAFTAAGIYKPKEKVIRLAKAGDLPTAIHEVGHHIQETMGFPEEMPSEIKTLAYEGAKDLNREGFAEFVKYYITEPDFAKSEAPMFFTQFEESLKLNPDLQEVFIKARQAHKLWIESPSVQKVHSFIVKGGTRKSLPTLNEAYTYIKDSMYPLKLAVDKAKETGREFKPLEDPYHVARLTAGWPRKAYQYLKMQTFQYDPIEGVQFTGPSLVDILSPVERTGEIPLLDTYLTAKRAVEDPRVQKGFTGILGKEDFRQTVSELEPRFRDVAEKLYKYSGELLTYLEESGRISGDTANTIRVNNLFYAPLYRVMDFEVSGTGLSKRKFSNIFNPIKRLKGSSRDIISPTESLVYNTYAMINSAERQRVGNALIKLAEVPGMGEIIEKVPRPIKPIKMTVEEALRSVSKLLDVPYKELKASLEASGLPETLLEEVLTTFRPITKTGPNEAIFFSKGQPYLYELDPALANAITSIDSSSIGVLTKFLSLPAKVLRAGATTFSPEFAIRNPMRDQMVAFIQSKYGYRPMWDFGSGLFHMLGKDELWQKYNASGAAHAALVSMDRNYLSKNLRQLMRENTVKNVVKHPLEALQKLSEYTEEATRVGEFAQALKKEGGDLNALLKAGLAAREVSLDFSRTGGPTARAINMVSAFWNARLEGVDKMVRSFKERPVSTSTKAFLGVTLPSVLLWYQQKDDPYYQELPSWRKVLFWNIVLHNSDGTLKTIIPIPKPFEYGLLFGSLPESALDWAYHEDPTSFKNTAEQIAKTLDIVPIPTGVIPLAEWWADKSWFFERPIVPRDTIDLEPVLQYGPHTSETVKLVAKMMHEIPGLKEIASPAKIENLIRGYTAGFGKLALEQGDWLIKTLGIVDVPADPSMTLDKIPGIRAFSVRFPTANSQSIETFYEKYGKLKQQWESEKQRLKIRGLGIPVKQPELLITYEATAKALSVMRKMAKLTYENKKLDSEEKREQLDNIYYGMVNTARAALKKQPIKQ